MPDQKHLSAPSAIDTAAPAPFVSIGRFAPTRRAFALGATAGIIASAIAPRARAAASAPQVLLDSAHAVIEDAKHDPQFGDASTLLRRCRGVMVAPQLVKGGFFFGAEGGDAVLISRQRDGAWGQPAFYVIASASFGLQIGLEVAELVLFVMTERALQAFMSDEFKIGAEAGLTVLVVGSNAQAALTGNAGVDLIAWAKSKGAYAGLTLEGSVIKPRNDYNTEYYGRSVTASTIVNGGVPAISNGANALRRSLAAG
jgi:lipid-binding SYLF domain-containing protein